MKVSPASGIRKKKKRLPIFAAALEMELEMGFQARRELLARGQDSPLKETPQTYLEGIKENRSWRPLKVNLSDKRRLCYARTPILGEEQPPSSLLFCSESPGMQP